MSRQQFGGQSPRHEITDVEELLIEGARILESVNRNYQSAGSTIADSSISLTVRPGVCQSENIRTTRASGNSPQHRSFLNAITQTVSTASTRSIPSTCPTAQNRNAPVATNVQVRNRTDSEIERISRYCANMDRSLRSIGIDTSTNRANVNNPSSSSSSSTTSTPLIEHRATPRIAEIVDLSNYDTENDSDILLVDIFPPQNNVIDLCTPTHNNSRRRASSDVSTQNSNLPSVSQPNARGRRYSRLNVLNQSINLLNSTSASTNGYAAPTSAKVRRISLNSKKNSNEDDESANSNDLSKDNSPGPYKCPVCLEPVHQNDPMTTKCGHVFCQKCITLALRENKKCPMCNMKTNSRQLVRLYL